MSLFEQQEIRAGEATRRPKQTKWIDCGKCSGTGYIAAFGHILGGVCFKCDGRKKIEVSVAYKPSALYTIRALIVEDTGSLTKGKGETGIVYNETGKSPAEALRKAKQRVTRACESFRRSWAPTDTWTVELAR